MSKSSWQILQRSHSVLLAVAIAIYILPIFLFPRPQDPNSPYHFSNLQIVVLSASVLIPWVTSWIFGVVGYLRLKRYARAIKDAESARPFYLLTYGIMVLVWGLILGTLVSSFRSRNMDVPEILIGATIVANYLYALAPLIGFYFIWKAIRLLNSRDSKPAAEQFSPMNIMTWAGLAAISGIYIFLIFTNPNRDTALNATTPATYYMPDWLTLLTIALPVIVSWTLGAVAIINMYRYKRVVSGFIYRKFMGTLAYGVILIVTGSVLLQGLQSLGAQRLTGAGLESMFALVYAFLIVQLVGYILVSRGSKKLTLIETA